jgi:hypothetical protein
MEYDLTGAWTNRRRSRREKRRCWNAVMRVRQAVMGHDIRRLPCRIHPGRSSRGLSLIAGTFCLERPGAVKGAPGRARRSGPLTARTVPRESGKRERPWQVSRRIIWPEHPEYRGPLQDEGAGAPRTTPDVDAIAEITPYAEYAAFGQRLRSDSPKTPVKEHPCAGRFTRERSSMSCPWMRRFSDSPVAGIAPPWKPRPAGQARIGTVLRRLRAVASS